MFHNDREFDARQISHVYRESQKGPQESMVNESILLIFLHATHQVHLSKSSPGFHRTITAAKILTQDTLETKVIFKMHHVELLQLQHHVPGKVSGILFSHTVEGLL